MTDQTPSVSDARPGLLDPVWARLAQLEATVTDLKVRLARLEDRAPKRTFKPPTVEEVAAYVKEKGLRVSPEKFMQYFTDTGWVDSKGQRVRSWKGKLLTWESCGLGREGSARGATGGDRMTASEFEREFRTGGGR